MAGIPKLQRIRFQRLRTDAFAAIRQLFTMAFAGFETHARAHGS